MPRTNPAKPVKPEDGVNDVNEEPEILWRNQGGGSFWFRKHIIKPNQTFRAKESEIPAAFRDVLAMVDGVAPASAAKPAPIKGNVAMFKKVPNGENPELFDVVRIKKVDGKEQQLKPLNAKGLTEAEADELLETLK